MYSDNTYNTTRYLSKCLPWYMPRSGISCNLQGGMGYPLLPEGDNISPIWPIRSRISSRERNCQAVASDAGRPSGSGFGHGACIVTNESGYRILLKPSKAPTNLSARLEHPMGPPTLGLKRDPYKSGGNLILYLLRTMLFMMMTRSD